MREKLLIYLQSQMDNYKEEEKLYGVDDRRVREKLENMIACKEMAEALIGEPVNLRLDGKVTIGF